MDFITLTINGTEVKTKKGTRILEAALEAGIYIPTLCFLKDMKLPFGACRLCFVEIEGRKRLVTSCTEPCTEGMVVLTDTPGVQKLRRDVLELLFVKHPHACLTCDNREGCSPGQDDCPGNTPLAERCCAKKGHCELQKVADYIGINPDTPPTENYNLFLDCTENCRRKIG